MLPAGVPSTNRKIVIASSRPDERDNSSQKRLIAAGLELLSLPASGSREEEKEGEKGGTEEKVESDGGREEDSPNFSVFRSRTHAREHARTHAPARTQ